MADGDSNFTNLVASGNATVGGTLTAAAVTLGATALTATATELNRLAGVTPGTTSASKALVVDGSKAVDTLTATALTTSGLTLGATAVTATGTEVNRLAGVTPGTTSASKALVVDGSKALDSLTVTTLTAPAVSGTTAVSGRLTTTDGVASGVAKVVGGLAYSQTAAGSALTGSATETVLGTFTLPASTIKQGTVIRVRYQGIATATNSTDTLTIRLRMGTTTLTGTALIATAAIDVNNNDIFTGMYELVGRAAPSAASAVVGVGFYNDPGATGGAMKTSFLGSTNFATNGALLVEVTGQFSTTSAGNSCRLDVLDIDIL